MGKVYIGFSRSNGILGRLICWFTRGDVTHAAVVYQDELWGGWWVAESNIHGVHTRPMHKRDWRYMYEPRYDIRPDLQVAKEYIDRQYDFLGLLAFGWVLLLWRLLKLRVRFPARTPSGQICSEFAARAARRVIGNKDPQWISPIELKNMVAGNGALFSAVAPSAVQRTT